MSLDQKPITISAVCGLVTKFNEAMPEYLQQALCDMKRGNRDLGDRSYGSGARYLLELIEAHKAGISRAQRVVSEQDLSKT